MNNFSFKCPDCGQPLKSPEDMLGEMIECPACKNTIQIPKVETTITDDPLQADQKVDRLKQAIVIIQKATNIGPLLENLRSGKIIRDILSVSYQAIAVLTGLALLYFWFRVWPVIGELRFFGGIGLLIWQFSFLYASFLSIKAFFLRAREIKDYADSEYIVVPVIATLIKTYGEMSFIFLGAMSLPAMLLSWLGAGQLAYYFDFFHSGNVFLSGIIVFLMSWVFGFISLLSTRLLAEWTLAIFSIAHDVNVLRRASIPNDHQPAVSASASNKTN